MTRTVLIIGGSSDIGQALIGQYLKQNCKVIATYRNYEHMVKFMTEKKEPNKKNLTLFPLEMRNYIQRYHLFEYMETTQTYWDDIIFLNGTTLPIGAFMDVDVNQWEESIRQNSIIPAQLLQKLYEVRNKDKVCNVCFFSGGGINGVFDNFSAYTMSKFMLHKFVELLNSECEDLNPFIIGPSFVKTKIHEEILANKESAGKSFHKAAGYLEKGAGTPHDDWKNKDFFRELKKNPNSGKMRRSM
jgi:NAD(P)-dependent dehydrogenase (short-subunit alcohol dehydrogenase family)